MVNDSWPLKRDGKTSQLAVVGLDNLDAAIRTVDPKSPHEPAFYNHAVSQLSTALSARQTA